MVSRPTLRQGIIPGRGTSNLIGESSSEEVALNPTAGAIAANQITTPVPSIYSPGIEQVNTPQGPVSVTFGNERVGNSTVFVPLNINKNVGFNLPISNTSGNISTLGNASFTYSLQNGKLVPVQTGQSGSVTYQNQNLVGQLSAAQGNLKFYQGLANEINTGSYIVYNANGSINANATQGVLNALNAELAPQASLGNSAPLTYYQGQVNTLTPLVQPIQIGTITSNGVTATSNTVTQQIFGTINGTQNNLGTLIYTPSASGSSITLNPTSFLANTLQVGEGTESIVNPITGQTYNVQISGTVTPTFNPTTGIISVGAASVPSGASPLFITPPTNLANVALTTGLFGSGSPQAQAALASNYNILVSPTGATFTSNNVIAPSGGSVSVASGSSAFFQGSAIGEALSIGLGISQSGLGIQSSSTATSSSAGIPSSFAFGGSSPLSIYSGPSLSFSNKNITAPTPTSSPVTVTTSTGGSALYKALGIGSQALTTYTVQGGTLNGSTLNFQAYTSGIGTTIQSDLLKIQYSPKTNPLENLALGAVESFGNLGYNLYAPGQTTLQRGEALGTVAVLAALPEAPELFGGGASAPLAIKVATGALVGSIGNVAFTLGLGLSSGGRPSAIQLEESAVVGGLFGGGTAYGTDALFAPRDLQVESIRNVQASQAAGKQEVSFSINNNQIFANIKPTDINDLEAATATGLREGPILQNPTYDLNTQISGGQAIIKGSYAKGLIGQVFNLRQPIQIDVEAAGLGLTAPEEGPGQTTAQASIAKISYQIFKEGPTGDLTQLGKGLEFTIGQSTSSPATEDIAAQLGIKFPVGSARFEESDVSSGGVKADINQFKPKGTALINEQPLAIETGKATPLTYDNTNLQFSTKGSIESLFEGGNKIYSIEQTSAFTESGKVAFGLNAVSEGLTDLGPAIALGPKYDLPATIPDYDFTGPDFAKYAPSENSGISSASDVLAGKPAQGYLTEVSGTSKGSVSIYQPKTILNTQGEVFQFYQVDSAGEVNARFINLGLKNAATIYGEPVLEVGAYKADITGTLFSKEGIAQTYETYTLGNEAKFDFLGEPQEGTKTVGRIQIQGLRGITDVQGFSRVIEPEDSGINILNPNARSTSASSYKIFNILGTDQTGLLSLGGPAKLLALPSNIDITINQAFEAFGEEFKPYQEPTPLKGGYPSGQAIELPSGGGQSVIQLTQMEPAQVEEQTSITESPKQTTKQSYSVITNPGKYVFSEEQSFIPRQTLEALQERQGPTGLSPTNYIPNPSDVLGAIGKSQSFTIPVYLNGTPKPSFSKSPTVSIFKRQPSQSFSRLIGTGPRVITKPIQAPISKLKFTPFQLFGNTLITGQSTKVIPIQKYRPFQLFGNTLITGQSTKVIPIQKQTPLHATVQKQVQPQKNVNPNPNTPPPFSIPTPPGSSFTIPIPFKFNKPKKPNKKQSISKTPTFKYVSDLTNSTLGIRASRGQKKSLYSKLGLNRPI